mgnify:CR=1 FL=1
MEVPSIRRMVGIGVTTVGVACVAGIMLSSWPHEISHRQRVGLTTERLEQIAHKAIEEERSPLASHSPSTLEGCGWLPQDKTVDGWGNQIYWVVSDQHLGVISGGPNGSIEFDSKAMELSGIEQHAESTSGWDDLFVVVAVPK